MQLYAYHRARCATDILRWQHGLRQDGLHADEERQQPRHFCGSADVGLRTHLVEVRLCEARSWPVDCRHVKEQLASIVRIKLGLRMHGVTVLLRKQGTLHGVQGKTADPGFIVHWTFPPGLKKPSIWLAYYACGASQPAGFCCASQTACLAASSVSNNIIIVIIIVISIIFMPTISIIISSGIIVVVVAIIVIITLITIITMNIIIATVATFYAPAPPVRPAAAVLPNLLRRNGKRD